MSATRVPKQATREVEAIADELRRLQSRVDKLAPTSSEDHDVTMSVGTVTMQHTLRRVPVGFEMLGWSGSMPSFFPTAMLADRVVFSSAAAGTVRLRVF